mmetsp:Transcript_4798/g.13778  ORF Transcript_4798/g.13778 Transcript_4798/m.13778 type:complete len:249 (-) Transcript_4798:289-1035(-)
MSWPRHSTSPNRAWAVSNARTVNSIVGNRLLTSLNSALDAFILRWYVSLGARLNSEVSFSSSTRVLPSPVETTMSMAYTSFSSNSPSSTLASGDGRLSTHLFASITNCFIWWVITPSTRLQPYDSTIFLSGSATSAILRPGRISLRAASIAVAAADITSAALPVTGAEASDCTTTVVASVAMNPSMCAPRSIFATSPSFNSVGSSLDAGEKWPTTLLTDTQVGKAMPFSIFLPLNILPTASSMKASPF